MELVLKKEGFDELKQTGKLDISGSTAHIFSILNSSVLRNYVNSIKILDISKTSVSNPKGIPKMPNIRSFIADFTFFDTYENIDCIYGVSCVSFLNTPISREKWFRESLALVLGNSLRSINGNQCRISLSRFPKCVRDLIIKGWKIPDGMISENDIIAACNEFDIQYVGSPKDTKMESSIDDVIESYHQKQRYMFDLYSNMLSLNYKAKEDQQTIFDCDYSTTD